MSLDRPITSEDVERKQLFRTRGGKEAHAAGQSHLLRWPWAIHCGDESYTVTSIGRHSSDSEEKPFDLISRIPPEPAMESQVVKRAYISIKPHEATFTDKSSAKWTVIRFDKGLINIVPQEGNQHAVIQTDAAQLKEIAEFAEHGA